MADVLVPLLAAILGGIVVLTAQILVRRSEERHRWAAKVQKAAADLGGSYAAGRSAVLGARKRGEELPSEDRLLYIERNRHRGHLLCTPGAEVLTDRIGNLHSSFEALVEAFDQPEDSWEAALTASRRALLAFEAEVRTTVDQQSSVVDWRPHRARSRAANIDELPDDSLPSV